MVEQTLVTKRRRYRCALEDALRDIVAALARRPEVERAILFGSYVEGHCDLFTDLDILVVIKSPLDFGAHSRDVPLPPGLFPGPAGGEKSAVFPIALDPYTAACGSGC